jgi:hypothetical protein
LLPPPAADRGFVRPWFPRTRARGRTFFFSPSDAFLRGRSIIPHGRSNAYSLASAPRSTHALRPQSRPPTHPRLALAWHPRLAPSPPEKSQSQAHLRFCLPGLLSHPRSGQEPSVAWSTAADVNLASTYPPITPTHRGSFRTTSFLPPTCGFRFLRRRGAVALTGCRLGRRGLCATLRTGHRISALVHTRIMLTDPPPLLHHQKLHSTSARRGAVNKSGSIATLCQLSATRRLEPPLGIKSCLRP